MPKNSKKNQGGKKLQLSNKQFDDLLKEIGGLPEGLNLDPSLLAALREATDEQFNKVAKEKFGEIPQESDDEMEEESNTAEQGTSSKKEEKQEQPSTSSNNA